MERNSLYIGLAILACLFILSSLLAYYLRAGADTLPLTGKWTLYNLKKEKAGYDWRITQSSPTSFEVYDSNMPTTKAIGAILNDSITITPFKLQGKLSANKKQIGWSDGTYWAKV